MLIDPHHHLWDASHFPWAPRYMPEDFLAQIAGLGIAATVFLECHTHYDTSLPEPLQPVGETRFAAAVGQAYANAETRLCAGIVACADPLADMDFATILDAHEAVAQGRLRGIRRVAAWDEDPTLVHAQLGASRNMLADPRFPAALRVLADRGLVFETWIYHPQLDELTALARQVPACTVMLDHAGTPAAIGRHSDVAASTAQWREAIAHAAEAPNMLVKIGGLAMLSTAVNAVRVARGDERWTIDTLAEALAPFVEHLIASFGPERCLWESNFPVDGGACDYATLFHAYEKVLAGLPGDHYDAIMGGNAARVYRIAAP